jgi:DNA-binding CsgD family transcriptional regulator
MTQIVAYRPRYIRPKKAIAQGDPLTVREIEVLILTGRGMSAKVIGRRLGLSPRSTMTVIVNFRKKLGATNKAHAMVLALSKGAVEIGDFWK